MNNSVLIRSLKYLQRFHAVSLSRWIYEELIEVQYSEDKLERSLKKDDIKVTESIIHLVQDKDILDYHLVYTKHLRCPEDTSCTDKIYNYNIRIPLLLKHGADPHYFDDYHADDENYLMYFACTEGLLEVVKILIYDYKFEPNIYFIYLAINDGRINVVRFFLEYGIDVNTSNDYTRLQKSLLTNACHQNNIEIVKLLLEYGADIHHDNDYALKTACRFSSKEIVSLLLEYGANNIDEILKIPDIRPEIIDILLKEKK